MSKAVMMGGKTIGPRILLVIVVFIKLTQDWQSFLSACIALASRELWSAVNEETLRVTGWSKMMVYDWRAGERRNGY
jgi:hypothetical protein